MKKYQIIEKEDYILIINPDGKELGLSKNSKVNIIEEKGYAFKDLNKNGKLDPYEDYRLPMDIRIKDLVSKMSIKQIAGLMLYSNHQSVVSNNKSLGSRFAGTYDGKSLEESKKEIYDLTDQQLKFLKEDDLRHVLVTAVDDAYTAAKWSNNLQSYVESLDLGIPVNISSDPRHGTVADTEFNAGSGSDISKWPEALGLAATFDETITKRFGEIASKEYRALGITTALSPQIDMASEPRWMRFNGTFGEHSELARDHTRAYCDGFQTTDQSWGNESVNTMVKHWPGGGSGEGGRDGHFGYGKFAVYPGSNFDEHLIPFVDGAFDLKDGTNKASAVMPYYTISYLQDTKYYENVGNAYNKYIITDLLREKYKYDGVVCTDWSVTKDSKEMDKFLSGKAWGLEDKTVEERHYLALLAGVDQFGGNNDVTPILKAYEMLIEEVKEEAARERFEASGYRLMKNIFNTNLFENPYLDPKESSELVGNPDFNEEGYQAQLKSIVLLKNKNEVLPMNNKLNVYIPERRIGESQDWFGRVRQAHTLNQINDHLVNHYYHRVSDPSLADFSIVFIESAHCVCFNEEEGYLPISLQYRPYKAIKARKNSIAKDDKDMIIDRTYYNKEVKTINEADLDIILETREKMKDKPVIVVMNCKNPMVVKEFENEVDGFLIHFGVSNQAILDIISGKVNPSGLLPFQMPKDMETVELQNEDVSLDMDTHKDELGNDYDFAFGMNYQGIIQDERVSKYKK